MSAPRCRKCNDCHNEPFADEFGEFFGYECTSSLLDRTKHTGWIGSGCDDDAALPKTSPRWCPKRKRGEGK